MDLNIILFISESFIGNFIMYICLYIYIENIRVKYIKSKFILKQTDYGFKKDLSNVMLFLKREFFPGDSVIRSFHSSL